jgi:hypothetical protein
MLLSSLLLCCHLCHFLCPLKHPCYVWRLYGVDGPVVAFIPAVAFVPAVVAGNAISVIFAFAFAGVNLPLSSLLLLAFLLLLALLPLVASL